MTQIPASRFRYKSRFGLAHWPGKGRRSERAHGVDFREFVPMAVVSLTCT